MTYKYIIAESHYHYYKAKLPIGKTLDELKEQIAHAFHQGIILVTLYKDGRKKNDYLQIKKDQFDISFIEESYIKIQRKNEFDKKVKRINLLKSYILETENEIKKLELELIPE